MEKKQPRPIALALLKQHKTPALAAERLDQLVVSDPDLRKAMVADYITLISAPKSTARTLLSRRKPGRHRRPGNQPSAQQKRGALAAERDYAHNIFLRKLRGGRRLGEIKVNELNAFAESSASAAASFQDRGFEDQVEAIAFRALANYCVPTDPFALLKDVIKPAVVNEIFENARAMATQTLRESKARQAKEALKAGEGLEMPEAPPSPPTPRRRRGSAGLWCRHEHPKCGRQQSCEAQPASATAEPGQIHHEAHSLGAGLTFSCGRQPSDEIQANPATAEPGQKVDEAHCVAAGLTYCDRPAANEAQIYVAIAEPGHCVVEVHAIDAGLILSFRSMT